MVKTKGQFIIQEKDNVRGASMTRTMHGKILQIALTIFAVCAMVLYSMTKITSPQQHILPPTITRTSSATSPAEPPSSAIVPSALASAAAVPIAASTAAFAKTAAPRFSDHAATSTPSVTPPSKPPASAIAHS